MPMPLYTYRCQDCQKRFEVRLSYEEYGEKTVRCPHCKGEDVTRRIERVRIARSGGTDLENLSPEQLSDLEDNPRALGRMMRQMGEEMGEELGPEFDEVVSRLEKGQDPEQISREIPDLGEDFGDTNGSEDLI
jgi:putative FmdB family regulatory protein